MEKIKKKTKGGSREVKETFRRGSENAVQRDQVGQNVNRARLLPFLLFANHSPLSPPLVSLCLNCLSKSIQHSASIPSLVRLGRVEATSERENKEETPRTLKSVANQTLVQPDNSVFFKCFVMGEIKNNIQNNSIYAN